MPAAAQWAADVGLPPVRGSPPANLSEVRRELSGRLPTPSQALSYRGAENLAVGRMRATSPFATPVRFNSRGNVVLLVKRFLKGETI
jgi:hypothetical protein